MNKALFFLTGLLFISGVRAEASVNAEGAKYDVLSERVISAPTVVEFFSFYCPACYRYDTDMKVTDSVKKALPEGVSLTRYHASFMGKLGNEMTRAWSVAILMNMEDKIKPLLFDAVQKKHSVRAWRDIRNLFIAAGVEGRSFDAAWDSFAVQALTEKQNQLAKSLRVSSIPAIFINGEYQINPAGMNTDSMAAFVSDYTNTVRQLLNNK
ncbi:DsbA family protein [Salmonella enterica]